jgi:hypothetical protein
LAHQASAASKATKQISQGKSKGHKLLDQVGGTVAVPSQVVARRRELSKRQAEKALDSVEPKRLPQANVKGIDSSGLRSTLTLRRV